jgi:ubiquitin carboxyl-terminal hydrolase 16
LEDDATYTVTYMPDKPVTVAAYAAGASLAAITLFYVFGPTFFIDGENSYNTSDGRKRGIIGLSNPANDCFINSVLQALAGLGDLRLYLIRELHRRKLEGPEIFETLPSDLNQGEKPEKILILQAAVVTKALKVMLDALNERPIYKKTITARPFIVALEKAFQTRISRNQQDAQEFLQIVVERLSDEYHAAEKARKRAALERPSSSGSNTSEGAEKDELDASGVLVSRVLLNGEPVSAATEKDEGFPFEGKLSSQIQCQHCGFETKPSVSSFVSLTLNVPQKVTSTTLDECFDLLLKSEEIEDFKCDKCKLTHALEWKKARMQRAKSEKEYTTLEDDAALIQQALDDDPEKPPPDVELPEQAPKRKIKKHMRITLFPKIVAIHLSRSVYDPRSHSMKNMAKVSYPERLRLGGILNEKWYKLLGVVCHKGTHNSGHYESFRRNHLYPPFATPDAFSGYAAASRNTSLAPSSNPSPRMTAQTTGNGRLSPESNRSTPSLTSTSLSVPSSRPTSQGQAPTDSGLSTPRHAAGSTNEVASTEQASVSSLSKPVTQAKEAASRLRRKKKSNDRWWRISDDKIKEARTSDVLAMQREVYLLFYELERPGDDATS